MSVGEALLELGIGRRFGSVDQSWVFTAPMTYKPTLPSDQGPEDGLGTSSSLPQGSVTFLRVGKVQARHEYPQPSTILLSGKTSNGEGRGF